MYKYLLFFSLLFAVTHAQGFLRKGNQMDSDTRAENKLDEDDALSGMTREMFLMQDCDWELQPPVLDDDCAVDLRLRRHIQQYTRTPVKLQLLKRKGKYGLRAVGKLDSGKKLRAFWRQGGTGSSATRLKSSDFLQASYDDAVRSRLFMVEFELQLPKLNKKQPAPSIVYSVAVEPGSMNSKAMVPRGAGRVKVFSAGRDAPAVPAGKCNVGVSMRAGLVDPSWAKGRAIFRKGRPAGII
jgi:hypothetical protein